MTVRRRPSCSPPRPPPTCGLRNFSSQPAVVEGATLTLALLETTDIHSNVLGYNYYSLLDDATLGLDRASTLIRAGPEPRTRTICCSTTAT
jgi:2',3'-cyclic-nucleotide 2'-phosphodiesterase (5'-nucleotidase family)